MFSPTALLGRHSWASLKICSHLVSGEPSVRWYAKSKPPCDPLKHNPPCRRAYDDIPPPVDPNCPKICNRYKKKKGILHKIKLHVTEGGTNFGTPFRWLDCKPCTPEGEKKEKKEKKVEPPKALAKRPKETPPLKEERRGLQVSVLGADTNVGQYVSLLLKQCPFMKKLRLYESKCNDGCSRSLTDVVQDLQHINTNCRVQAFSCQCYELERCLQNTDIVLMLDSGYVSADMSLKDRFAAHAPIVKGYTEAISNECPKAFIIVAASPIDCMVPIVAETLRSTGWYDPAKVLGSLAVPEMRASTLAALSLGLEPRYTRVQCIGGTEGASLVPLFSRAVDYFEFCEKTAEYMTEVVRSATSNILRTEGCCTRTCELSEAHALTGLVSKVAHALLCCDVPRVTGFVETNSCQIVSPANYLAIDVLLNDKGICHRFDFPSHLSNYEVTLLETAMTAVTNNVNAGNSWFHQNHVAELKRYGCSHNRAWRLYAESVLNPGGFPATLCQQWKGPRRLCSFRVAGYMGFAAQPPLSGKMYLETNQSPPFAKNGP